MVADRIQEPPNSIRLSIVEGCNLRCTFCGLQSIRGKNNDYKLMPLETAAKLGALLKKAGWKSRFEIGVFGEETVHPQLEEIVRLVKPEKSHVTLITNGYGLMRDTIGRVRLLLEAGVDTIIVDDYVGINYAAKIQDRLSKTDLCLQNYPSDGLEVNPHTRNKRGEKRIVFVIDPSRAEKGTHSYLHNYTGLGGPASSSKMGKRCAKPFRELVVRHDGLVPICCLDWRGEYIIGDINKIDDIQVLWQSIYMNAARRKLYYGERDFGPCEGCTNRSYRVGFLPDKIGKQEIPKVESQHKKAIKKATTHRWASKPVKTIFEDSLPLRRRAGR